MLDEKVNENNTGDDKNRNDRTKSKGGQKKKLAVVFHSQNSVNHKNHPLGKLSKKMNSSAAVVEIIFFRDRKSVV